MPLLQKYIFYCLFVLFYEVPMQKNVIGLFSNPFKPLQHKYHGEH
jgi:hypothetical protein